MRYTRFTTKHGLQIYTSVPHVNKLRVEKATDFYLQSIGVYYATSPYLVATIKAISKKKIIWNRQISKFLFGFWDIKRTRCRCNSKKVYLDYRGSISDSAFFIVLHSTLHYILFGTYDNRQLDLRWWGRFTRYRIEYAEIE